MTTARTEHSFRSVMQARLCVRLRMAPYYPVFTSDYGEYCRGESQGREGWIGKGAQGEECQQDGGLANRRLSTLQGRAYLLLLIKTTESKRHWPSSTSAGGDRRVRSSLVGSPDTPKSAQATLCVLTARSSTSNQGIGSRMLLRCEFGPCWLWRDGVLFMTTRRERTRTIASVDHESMPWPAEIHTEQRDAGRPMAG